MALTLFLAQLFGLVLIVKGLFILIRPEEARKMVYEIGKSRLLTYSIGMFVVIIGLFLTMIHNVWTTTPAAVVSAIAWLTLLKGILIVFAPNATENIFKPFLKNDSDVRGLAIVVLIVGVYLVYIGFGL